MCTLHQYIRHFLVNQVSSEEKIWFLETQPLHSVSPEKYFQYIPALLDYVNSSSEYDSHNKQRAYAILKAIMPHDISADDANRVLCILNNKDADKEMHLEFISKINFPKDADVTPLERITDDDQEQPEYRLKAVSILARIRETDVEQYLIHKLRKNAGAPHGDKKDGCPDRAFVYESLGKTGSILTVPSLVAELQDNPVHKSILLKAIKDICKREGIPDKVAKDLSDPEFWKMEWDGNIDALAVCAICFGLEHAGDSPQEILAIADYIGNVLIKELNIDISPHRSLVEMMSSKSSENILNILNQAGDSLGSMAFIEEVLKGTKVTADNEYLSEDAFERLADEYLVTRLSSYFNIIDEE